MTQPQRDAAPTSLVVPDDWPAQAADRIEGLVGTVRDKTTGPVMTAARWAVYGLVVLVVGLVALLLITIGALRGLDELFEGIDGERRVWASYLVLGLPLTIAGLVLLGKARRAGRSDDATGAE